MGDFDTSAAETPDSSLPAQRLATEADLVERLDGISPATEPEEVINLIGLIEGAQRRLREMKKKADAALIPLLEARGPRGVTLGHLRFYVGEKKSFAPKSNRDVAEAVLRACEGDLERFIECLAAGAFRPGATRKLLGDEEWGKVFTVYIEKEVREGKAGPVEVPVRTVHVIDERFVK